MNRLVFGIAVALVPLTALGAYPERPVRMIVPWAAGGDTDNIFRPFGQVLQKHLGQTVVIRIGDRRLRGRAESLSEDGALLLRSEHGHLENIMGGDVGIEKA